MRIWDVPATLHDQREVGEYGRLVSRLVGDAAIVWDVPATEVERMKGLLPPLTPVLVAPAQSQPALAELVAERAMLAIRGRRPGGEFGAALARLAMLVGAEPH